MNMGFQAEGLRQAPRKVSRDFLRRAQQTGAILEARAISFGPDKALHLMMGNIPLLMPYEECADGVSEGQVRDIALITRVGRPVCFIVTDVPNEGPILVSRAAAQEKCKKLYLNTLLPGDTLPCRVTHLEPFGAFCDVGCGISALLPIDCMSVSRIASPADRVKVGENIVCAVKSRDASGRLVLTMRELLGTWEENAAHFAAGETVIGIVRSVEEYGVFVELAPNLAGLAEPMEGLRTGQMVSVYIKNIVPNRMKIKLVILHALEDEHFRFPLQYAINSGHIDHWEFSPNGATRRIETVFQ